MKKWHSKCNRLYYVPSSRTMSKRTPLEAPGTNSARGVLLLTVLDEWNIVNRKSSRGGSFFRSKSPSWTKISKKCGDVKSQYILYTNIQYVPELCIFLYFVYFDRGGVSYLLCSLIKSGRKRTTLEEPPPKLINFGGGASVGVLFLSVLDQAHS